MSPNHALHSKIENFKFLDLVKFNRNPQQFSIKNLPMYPNSRQPRFQSGFSRTVFRSRHIKHVSTCHVFLNILPHFIELAKQVFIINSTLYLMVTIEDDRSTLETCLAASKTLSRSQIENSFNFMRG